MKNGKNGGHQEWDPLNWLPERGGSRPFPAHIMYRGLKFPLPWPTALRNVAHFGFAIDFRFPLCEFGSPMVFGAVFVPDEKGMR